MAIKRNSLVPHRREIVVFIYLATALFISVSLLTFSAQDPSWFYYHTDMNPITNRCGWWGAQCAALLIYLVGAASFLVPGFLVFLSWLIFFNLSWKYDWDRLASFLFFIPTGAALTAFYRIRLFRHSLPGGRVGVIYLKSFFGLFDYVGTIIVLHTLALISLILIFRFSFITILSQLVAGFHYLVERKHLFVQGLNNVSYVASRPLVFLYKELSYLWQGRDVLESDQSIVHFEGPVFDESKNDFTAHDFFEKPQSTLTVVKSSSVIPAASIDEEQAEPQGVVYSVPEDSLFEVRDQKGFNKKIEAELKERAKTLEDKLKRFGISGSVTSIKPGPVVTLFEYEPNIDIKISKILSLEDDLALALQALSIRIIAPIPGKSVVGFEVANQLRKSVYFSGIVQSQDFKNFSGSLPLVLGEDTTGSNVIVDLVKMPHLLVAGSTGSGKSVALNTMLISLLCSRDPDELKLILIDPKRLEFAAYADIAHLLFPIVTDPRKAVPVLKWVVQTMEERYELMAQEGSRTINDFNESVAASDRLPYIVVVIDELADLMMTAGNDVENLLTRLSQMARAAGIHLILATQRPSVDIVTGLIKVNFPSRISFKVTSKIDSRTILDLTGAEKLLGKGDMLFLNATSSILARVHGAYVSDKEINAVIGHIRAQRPPAYLNIEEELSHNQSTLLDADDELYQNVLSYLEETDEVSISMLQRRFRIGYNRSARIIEALESQGKIMPADGAKTRKVIRS
jgi:S-DNA-T family DNA segregation ATPase FtsK/SpoIIIE